MVEVVKGGVISMIKSMYLETTAAVTIGERESSKFPVCHQGSVLNVFPFIIPYKKNIKKKKEKKKEYM